MQNVKRVNKIKQKLRKLFINLDRNKEDLLPESAFFEILELNQIELSNRDKDLLCKKARGASQIQHNAIRYRDALQMINIDHEYSRKGQDPFLEQWLYRPTGVSVVDGLQADDLDVDIRSMTHLKKLTRGTKNEFDES